MFGKTALIYFGLSLSTLLDVRVSFLFLTYMYMNDLMNDIFASVNLPIGDGEKCIVHTWHMLYIDQYSLAYRDYNNT